MPPNTKVSIDRKNTYKSKRYGHEEITHSIRAGGHNKSEPIPPLDRSALIAQGSYEKCPRLTAILTQFGFYLLIFLGYLNQLLFPPKVTKERNREKSEPIPPLDRSALIAQGSYEKCPRLTAILTQFGFYLLIFLGYLNQLLFPPKVTKERNREKSEPIPPLDRSALIAQGSYEKCPRLTAILTQFGFYLLIFLGYLNQLLFPPKVTKERNREKSEPIPPLDRSALIAQGSYEKCPRLTAILTQFGFYLLIFLGYLNQLLFPPKVTKERNREGYAPLYRPFDQFYSRYVYRRVRHCFNRPVSSAPAEEITLMERSSDDYNWTMKFTGREQQCVNLGSYNYVGYRGGKKEVEDAARSYGLVLSSPRAELGSCQLYEQLENELAEFFGVEAAVVVGNGFLTNLLTLSALVGPDSLVLSDDSNHTSLILGMRLAQVPVRVFRHNDMKHLEQLAREARAEGRWQKIVIVLEGIYSMTGSLAALPAAVALKKQLGLHIYIDEAHSIGLGPRGRGATDACGVDPRDVDVLMGTFSKSFPGAGGYIAGSAALVSHLRAHGAAHAYVQAMPPPVTAQVLCALRDLRAPAGQARVIALKENIRYFRDRLQSMGVVVHGHEQSPVAAMLVYSPSKMVACVERLTAAGVAAAGVSFPATPMHQARMRFCLSAAHTREHLDTALAAIEAATDELGLRYSRQNKAIPQ